MKLKMQHMKNGWSMVLDLNLKLKLFFAYLSYRFQMNCWSRQKAAAQAALEEMDAD
jgi:hypothetical protein